LTIGFEGVLEEVDSKSTEGSGQDVVSRRCSIYGNNLVVRLDVTSTVVGPSDAPKAVESQYHDNEKADSDTVG
jgi:hypothetical protein